MSKQPQFGKPITKEYNTYKSWTGTTPDIVVGGEQQVKAISFDESAYIWGIHLTVGLSGTAVAESAGYLRLLSGYGATVVARLDVHRHTAGDPYVMEKDIILPKEAWIYVEKGDSIEVWVTGVPSAGAVNAGCTVLTLVKG